MIVQHAKNLAKQFVVKRFKSLDKNVRVKFNPSDYRKDLLSFYYAGASQLVQEVLNEHRKQAFKDVDEMIGEMEVIAGKCLDDFAKHIHDNPHKKKITSSLCISTINMPCTKSSSIFYQAIENLKTKSIRHLNNLTTRKITRD